MVRVLVTAQIQDAISKYNVKQGLSTDDPGYIPENLPSVEHLQLARLAVTLKLPLHELLSTTQLYLPPVDKPKPVPSKTTNLCSQQDPKYQAHMADLRRKLEEKEYNKMIANIKPAPKDSLFSDEDYSTDDAKMVKNQISAIINILFSMVSVFVAIFVWMKNSPDYLVFPTKLMGLMRSEFYGVFFSQLLLG
jgi:hypothetical protein